MMIRKATPQDADALAALFDEARATIAALGIDQWQDGYPHPCIIAEDIQKERAYVVEIDGQLCGTFVLMLHGESLYDRIYDGAWLTGEAQPYIAIHRVAISLSHRGSGISTAILDHAASLARAMSRASLRIDTHKGNVVMRRMLEKHGFTHCGTIYLAGGDARVAYEKTITKKDTLL